MPTINVQTSGPCAGGGTHITVTLSGAKNLVIEGKEYKDLKDLAREIADELIDAYIAGKTVAQLKTQLDGNGVNITVANA
jgi:Ethanolamine utilization protein EutJ (predicted chaperonin)